MPPNRHKPLSKKQRKDHPLFHKNIKHRAAVAIPDSFDSKTKWPKCTSISTIRNQGQCGTCWAVSSASVISDRMCISSGQVIQDFMSASHIAACTDTTQSGDDNCQAGGDPANAYKFFSTIGGPSGGEYNSKAGCEPYPVAPNAAPPLTCQASCPNTAYSKKTAVLDAHTIDSYWTTYSGDATPGPEVITQMQVDIMTNGPITAAITCYDDFQDWVPGTGQEPYEGPGPGAKDEGGHAIRVVGWGVSKQGKKYWRIANSWGTSVGDNGYFNILMGQNTVGIEGTVSAPIVKMPNTCGSMCDGPLDQIVKVNPSDQSSPVFLFQGNCSVQVTIGADGKMTQVGAPAPIGKNFVGGPAGPITSWMVSGSQLWLINPSGAAGACSPAPGSTGKQQCSSGTATAGASAQTVSNGNKYVYYNTPGKNQYIFQFPGGSNSGSGASIGTAITAKFGAVNALADVPKLQGMLVCGTDKSGNGQCGIMKYSDHTWAVAPGPMKNFLNC